MLVFVGGVGGCHCLELPLANVVTNHDAGWARDDGSAGFGFGLEVAKIDGWIGSALLGIAGAVLRAVGFGVAGLVFGLLGWLGLSFGRVGVGLGLIEVADES